MTDQQGDGMDVSASRGENYTVKSGDSLSKIAKHFYGDASQWQRIYDVNRETVSNPDLIHPGQKLYIPQG
jgi:nucleoid-associated protein YgaU